MAGPRVLLVSTADRQAQLIDALEAAGCTVQTATTATTALGTLSTDSYDCLVSERSLPGDDGLALRAAAWRLMPGLPVVLVDGDAERPVTTDSDHGSYRTDGDSPVDEVVATVLNSYSETVERQGFGVTDDRSNDRIDSIENDAFRRLGGRIGRLFGPLADVVVAATDRRSFERHVCETLTAEPDYTAAWIGHTDSDGTGLCPDNGDLRLSTAAGLSTATPTTVALADVRSAVERAVDSGEPHHVLGATDGVFAPASSRGRWLLVVPLRYGQRQYGLVGLCGVDAFEPWERTVGMSFGAMIATGFHAVETARVLTVDEVTELRVDFHDESFQLSRIAAALAGSVERCGTTGTDGNRELYLTTEAFVDQTRLDSLSFVDSVRVIGETETATTLSVSVSTVAPDDLLAEFGAVVTGATATADSAVVRIELPAQEAVGPLIDQLRTQYDTVDLRGRTDRERRERHPNEFAAVVDQQLTDRQRAALQAAWHNGYFEWPRPVDGESIATTMDITRQTFHQHLRAAERKLVAAYVDAQ